MEKIPNKKWSGKSWHRRASKPITLWMMVFILAGAVHTLIPNYRWVLIHLFTLGVVTNNIVVWSQYLTEKFVQARLPESARPNQLRRIYILNAGVVLAIIGQALDDIWDLHFILTQLGALIVGAMLIWHGASLTQQWRGVDSAKRFRPIILGYVGSALCLPVGAFFGAMLSMGLSEPWYGRLLTAHVVANIGGFIGLAAAASLTVLFPTMWRTKGITTRMNPTLALLAVGTAVTIAGALSGLAWMTGAGLVVYAAGWLASLQQWLRNVGAVLAEPRDRVSYPAVSVLAAVTWLALTIVYLAVQVFISGNPEPLPTLPLLIGFAGQLLIGVLSYIMPTTMGGGPSAVRAGLKEMNRGGLFRSTLINGGLIVWLITEKSWLAVFSSVLCIIPLAAFPVLMIRAVKAQKAVLMKQAEGPAPETESQWGQITAGLVTLALLLAVFRGI